MIRQQYITRVKPRWQRSTQICLAFQIWDVRSPPSKCIKTITSGGVTSDSTINDLTVNHPGTHVFAATGNTVKIWDLNKYLWNSLVMHDGRPCWCLHALQKINWNVISRICSFTSTCNVMKHRSNGFFALLCSYQMIGKLGGHAGHVMALLLLGNQEPYLMLTGSRDHYIKVL